MRIIAGEWRGRRLGEPARGAVRPTADRVREAVFDMLAAGDAIAGRMVLDAFAGTGALGLEALSRGAREAWFLEQDRGALAMLERNVRTLQAGPRAHILCRDAAHPGPAPQAAGLVLLDPPYRSGLAAPALSALDRNGWICADGVIVIESDRRSAPEIPPGFAAMDTRTYGRTSVTLAARA